jgi:hypothetical protein
MTNNTKRKPTASMWFTIRFVFDKCFMSARAVNPKNLAYLCKLY